MVDALFDTNILIDFLNGAAKARSELARYERRSISAITWMEVMVGVTAENDAGTRAFLEHFRVVDVDRPISERAVQLRRRHRMRLPDAIVWATAVEAGLVLVTRNTKDFKKDVPGVRIPYTL